MSTTAVQYIQNGKDTNSFLGMFRYIKTSGVKSSKEGELYGFLKISSEGEFLAERVANLAWDGIVEGYMYSKTKSTSESLKTGVTEFTRRLKDLMRNSKSLEETGIEVSLVIVAGTKEGIYIANVGENEIFAYKGGKIVNVIEVLEKNNAQTAGFPTDSNDLVIISTNSLLTENMDTMIGKSSKEDIMKSLEILSRTLLPNQGLLCVYKEKEVGIIEQIEKPKEVLVKESQKDIESDVKEVSTLEKVPKAKDFKVHKKIDIKPFLAKILIVLNKIWSVIVKVFGILKKFILNILSKLKTLLVKKFGNKRWFKKYAARASEMRFGKKKLPSIKIDGYKTKSLRLKRFQLVLLIALAIFLFVVGFQYARKQRDLRALNSQADQIFTEVEGKVKSAKEKLSTDTDSAQTFIFSASNLIAEVPEGIDQEHIDKRESLEAEILAVEDTLYKRVIVSPESFMGFFDEGTELSDIKYITDKVGNEVLMVTDSGTGSVWKISIYDRSKVRLTDSDALLKTPEFVDIGDSGDLYVFDSGVGVVKSTNSGSDWSSFTKLTGAGISNIKIDEVNEFGVFSSTDNLYYLDSKGGRIAKSVNYGGGYSSSVVNVLTSDNLAQANDFLADFSIYVLTSGNEGVLRFTSGAYTPISLVGVNGDLGDLTCGMTTGSLDFGMYIFDEAGKRVLRLEKPKEGYKDKLHPNELVLLNQYLYRGDDKGMFGNVKDLAVDKAEKYIYILDGNTVWRVGL